MLMMNSNEGLKILRINLEIIFIILKTEEEPNGEDILVEFRVLDKEKIDKAGSKSNH